ncbi:peptide ABC transporter substrate-binding protein [Paludicola sp. MB14-C6]|uniref:peptide ABC transporter substrate-binding protein n=1 Tax=Paludihabitans sp. MB14-C6 TaxID=3070656 RepID=UPI0027DD1E6D|nr:peptide ABC transporter substrate-binding protein [Paludicola sp. MB14-C6]WMJ23234.1 peptide ABC transporter substrate-binding protein [Paludicola sp. MB14-C6]
MKKILCFILILSMVLVFVGCGDSKKPIRLSYDIKEEPQNLDPQTATDKASLLVISNVFEGLMVMDDEGKLKPGMAKSYHVSSDKLTYTFQLRENIKWNDDNDKTTDQPVTADDFVFAFKRLIDPETNSKHAKLFYCIKNAQAINEGKASIDTLGVTATAKNEITFRLEYANDNFLRLLTKTSAVPCNQAFFEQTKGKYGLEPYTIMVNGPFVLAKWTHKESMRLVHNDNYYNQANVMPSSISLWIQTKSKDELQQEKEKNIVIDNSVERLLEEKTVGGMIDGFNFNKISKKGFDSEAMEGSTWGIAFNFNNKDLNNKNIRQAIATAFDRSTYESILPKSMSLATAIVPNSIMIAQQSYREYVGKNLVPQYDAKKAYELHSSGLKELGKNKISGIRLMVPRNANIAFKDHFLFPSQVLQRDLGIFIGIDEVSIDEYQSRLKKGDFDCAIVNLAAIENSPRSILSQFHTGSDLNYYGYSSSSVDQNLDKSAELSDDNQIIDCFKLVEQQIIDDVAFIPMYYKTDYFVTSQSIKKLKYNRQTGMVLFKDVKKN